MNGEDFCLAFECPLSEVAPELKQVCEQLGESCDTCDHRCP